jgi:choline dehydrogenase-like flavoprotein
MCFGGIENARILLEFNRKYDNKLGNQYDNVGRYFMEHPGIRATYFFPLNGNMNAPERSLYHGIKLDKRMVMGYLKLSEKAQREHGVFNLRMPLEKANRYRLSDGIASYHELADALGQGELPDQFGTHLSNVLGEIDMVAEAVSRKAFKKPLFDSANDITGYLMPTMVEQSPERNNRVKLGTEIDPHGLRRIEIDWRFSVDDQAKCWRILELAAQEVGALSIGRMRLLREYETRVFGDQLGFGQHHMGTTRMHDSETKGVVDKNSRVFGARNLYIGGSSVFTTGGHVPPTLTIVALAIRLAKYISQEYAQLKR